MAHRAAHGLVCLAAALLVPLASSSHAQSPPPADPEAREAIDVGVRGGLLTVDVRDAPLEEVLRVIGERAGVKITLHGDFGARVTRAFTDVPLADGIRRLVRGHSSGLSYTFARDRTGTGVLTEVRLVGGAPARPTPLVVDPRERAAQLRTVRELGRRADTAATADLARMLSEAPDPLVRARVAAALARVGGGQAAGALETALRDPAPIVRMQAIRSLGGVARDRVVPILGRVLLGDPEPSVRRAAAAALGASPTEEARQALQAAASDPDPTVRRTVAALLARWAR